MRKLFAISLLLLAPAHVGAALPAVGPFTASAPITYVKEAEGSARVDLGKGTSAGLRVGDEVWVTTIGPPIKIKLLEVTATTARGETQSIRGSKLKGEPASYVPWSCKPFPPTVPADPALFVEGRIEDRAPVGGDVRVLLASGLADRVDAGAPFVATDSTGKAYRGAIEAVMDRNFSRLIVPGAGKATITRVVVAKSSCLWASPPTGTKYQQQQTVTRVANMPAQVGANLVFKVAGAGAIPGTPVDVELANGSTKTFTVSTITLFDATVFEPGTASTVRMNAPASFQPWVCPPAKPLPPKLDWDDRKSPPPEVIFKYETPGQISRVTTQNGPIQIGDLEIRINAGSQDGVYPGAKVSTTGTPMTATIDHVQGDLAWAYVPKAQVPAPVQVTPRVTGVFIPTTTCWRP